MTARIFEFSLLAAGFTQIPPQLTAEAGTNIHGRIAHWTRVGWAGWAGTLDLGEGRAPGAWGPQEVPVPDAVHRPAMRDGQVRRQDRRRHVRSHASPLPCPGPFPPANVHKKGSASTTGLNDPPRCLVLLLLTCELGPQKLAFAPGLSFNHGGGQAAGGRYVIFGSAFVAGCFVVFVISGMGFVRKSDMVKTKRDCQCWMVFRRA